MSEIVNIPNNYKDSKIFDQIDIPKMEFQKILEETRDKQKSVSEIEDFKEKKKRQGRKKIQK